MTTHLFRNAALAGVAVVALAASGCGSKKDPTASFKPDYKAQSAKIKAIGDDIGSAIEGADKLTDAQVATKFGTLATRAHAAAAAILDLTPPAAYKADTAALTTALTKAADDLDDIVTAAKSGDVEAAKTATATLITDSAPVKTVHEKLDAATK